MLLDSEDPLVVGASGATSRAAPAVRLLVSYSIFPIGACLIWLAVLSYDVVSNAVPTFVFPFELALAVVLGARVYIILIYWTYPNWKVCSWAFSTYHLVDYMLTAEASRKSDLLNWLIAKTERSLRLRQPSFQSEFRRLQARLSQGALADRLAGLETNGAWDKVSLTGLATILAEIVFRVEWEEWLAVSYEEVQAIRERQSAAYRTELLATIGKIAAATGALAALLKLLIVAFLT